MKHKIRRCLSQTELFPSFCHPNPISSHLKNYESDKKIVPSKKAKTRNNFCNYNNSLQKCSKYCQSSSFLLPTKVTSKNINKKLNLVRNLESTINIAKDYKNFGESFLLPDYYFISSEKMINSLKSNGVDYTLKKYFNNNNKNIIVKPNFMKNKKTLLNEYITNNNNNNINKTKKVGSKYIDLINSVNKTSYIEHKNKCNSKKKIVTTYISKVDVFKIKKIFKFSYDSKGGKKVVKRVYNNYTIDKKYKSSNGCSVKNYSNNSISLNSTMLTTNLSKKDSSVC